MSLNLTPSSRPPSAREYCWTEKASATLINEWGRRYVELNRGNLRQKDWQEVADAVNSLHAHSVKTHRSGVQCKNRLDTIKKKYKIEKLKVLDSNGKYNSNWSFYKKLESLIGNKRGPSLGTGRLRVRVESEGDGDGDGVRELAKAVEGFARVYERVEGEKLREMVELGKRRLELEKEVEMDWMQMLVDTQVRLRTIERCPKRASPDDTYG